MNCFNHQNVPAVCSCGTCAKGLCQNCMQPCCGKFVCSETCGEYSEKITKMNEKALKIYGLDKPGKPKRLGMRTAILYLGIGIPALVYSIYEIANHEFLLKEPAFWFLLAMGSIFTTFGYKTYKDGIML
jgi:hypothetical protein